MMVMSTKLKSQEVTGDDCAALEGRAPLTHLFVELTSLEELSFPTCSSTRIKYTCVDASPHYLAVGSTSGTVYLFSRFASKNKTHLSSVPVQVISIKDGPVSKVAISPNEKFLASASKRGSLVICAPSAVGNIPTTILTCDCHVEKESDESSACITQLLWSSDSTKMYAGDIKGRISCSRVITRKFFRPSAEVLFETDSEIVQMDIKNDSLLVSTFSRSCLCDIRSRNCIQVGRKLRKGYYGAVFYTTEKNTVHGCAGGKSDMAGQGGRGSLSLSPTVIFASRPNGRIWETNNRGVVYRTHQYRKLNKVRQCPVVSFKIDACDLYGAGVVENITFGRLSLVGCEGRTFLISKSEKSIYLIDPADSRLIYVCALSENDTFDEYSVSGADLFFLSSKTGILRKLTLFPLIKAVEKLHWKQCFMQAANVICSELTPSLSSKLFPWKVELLQDIYNNVVKLSRTSARVPSSIRDGLQKLVSIAEEQQMRERNTNSRHSLVQRLNSGIHRVVQVMENSGYEDDFTFRAPSPLRLRSRSTPNMDISETAGFGWKRLSLPIKNGIIIEENGTSDRYSEEMRKKVMEEARKLLRDVEIQRRLALWGSVESLRTLLESNNQLITFDEQVTADNVAKDLEAAKSFLRFLASIKHFSNNCASEQLSFEQLFGRSDPLKMLENNATVGLNLYKNVSVRRLGSAKNEKKGARIIKGVKPTGRRIPIEAVAEKAELMLNGHTTLSENLKPSERREGKELEQKGDQRAAMNKSYVIEKNFVAARPIEITWTSEDQAGEDEVCLDNTNTVNSDNIVRNRSTVSSGALSLPSCTDYQNGCHEQLMESSEVTLLPSTITVSEEQSLKNDVNHCSSCGLHRMWRYIMIFGPRMSQLRVTVDQFSEGAVPTKHEQWTCLFNWQAEMRIGRSVDEEILCSDCAADFEFDQRLKEKDQMLRESFARIQKQQDTINKGREAVQKSTRQWTVDNVHQMFFNCSAIRDLGLCRKHHPLQPLTSAVSKENCEHVKETTKQCSVIPSGLYKKFSWLPAVTISQLLYCMRLCEGIDAVFHMLKKEESLLNSLTADDWRWLSVIKAYEAGRWFDVMPKEVVAQLLSDLKITIIEDVGPNPLEMIRGKNVNNSRSPSGSLILSLDGKCPCCALPLKIRVASEDCFLTVFRCGHLYHQVCLHQANLSRCLRCELERRRNLQRQQSRTTIPDASSRTSLRSRGTSAAAIAIVPRQSQAIKAVRTGVSSPLSAKIRRS